tara:strand:+ start:48 stop:239 length:192 start_codon:yes stop_codon:yes gene_type:complete
MTDGNVPKCLSPIDIIITIHDEMFAVAADDRKRRLSAAIRSSEYDRFAGSIERRTKVKDLTII